MNCKFCEQVKKDGTTENICITSKEALKIFITAHREGQYTIEVESFDTNGEEYWDESVALSYCPFCGRKIN